MSLRKIENHLGFKIIERNHKNYLRLTERGAQAVEIMREIVEHSNLLERIKTH
jgi:DNA-binding transcriptional LysR family regulator